MLEEIIRLYSEVKGIYGYRRMTLNVNSRLKRNYNHKRIYRLMKSVHMQAVIRRKKNHYVILEPRVTAENVLNREFTANSPNEKWLTDVTEFKYYIGVEVHKIYLSAILDLCDRRIVSYKISAHNDNALVMDTFDQAVTAEPDAHPLFHSDRGFQYTSQAFYSRLKKHHMKQSMSRVAHCIDNGPMEGFWGILKREMYYGKRFTSKEELIQGIQDYIEYYNNRRLQRKLHIMTPMAFHELTLKAA